MLWTAGIVLALSNFVAVLNMTIANVTVPNIAGALGAGSSQGTWVITSYAVAEAITVPGAGHFSALERPTEMVRIIRQGAGGAANS